MHPEPAPDDIPEVLPAGEPPRQRRACPHCAGTDLARGVKLGQTAEVGSIGPTYKGSSILGGAVTFLGHEPLYVDLCNACGTVVRLYVQETDRDWAEG
jgi:hypothetical protein